jgi:hypothetical protein
LRGEQHSPGFDRSFYRRLQNSGCRGTNLYLFPAHQDIAVLGTVWLPSMAIITPLRR